MAGTIDNLRFDIILNDEKFTQKIQANIKLAQELNTSLSNLLNLQARVKNTGIKTTSVAREIVNHEKVIAAQKRSAAAEEALAAAKNRTRASEEALAAATARKVTSQQNAIAATNRAAKSETVLQNAMLRTASAARTQSGALAGLKGMAWQYLSIRGIASFISSLVRVTGEFELQKTTLAAMLGDLSQAQSIMSDLKNLAIQSPFQFKELATYAKQLTAFAVPAEHLFETTKMLADVSAGLGVGMDRIVLAYGQVKSAAFLRGQEVRQFTEAGIPILNMLAKQIEAVEGQAISVGEVFDRISSRMISFEMVNQVFKDLTSEGGKFYKMQETQAETLRGKVSNLKDAYEIMLNEMGSQKSGFLKGTIETLRSLMKHWEAVGTAITSVVVAFGVYKGVLLSIAVAEKIAATKVLVHKWRMLNSVMASMGHNVNKLKTAWIVFGTSAHTALGLVGAAAGVLMTVLISNISKIGELKRELKGIVSEESISSQKNVDALEMLVASLKKATYGSQEYRDIINQLNTQYGEYLPKVLKEADAYNDVAIAAAAAAAAIRSKAKASARDRGVEVIEKKYGEDVNEYISALISDIRYLNPTIAEKSASMFVSSFLAALKREGGRDDITKTFDDTFDSYFGQGAMKNATVEFLRASDQDELTKVLKSIITHAKKLSHANQKLEKEEERLNSLLEARFSDAAYDSYKEEQRVAQIEEEYQKALSGSADALKKKEMSQKEYNKQVKNLDIKKLEQLRDLYKELNRQDKVDFYQAKIDAFKIPEDWRGTVQKVIDSMNLDKGTSFGLWADETTNSAKYVEEMVKRYKEIKEEIDLVSPFDEEQVKRLKKNKELIEAIAKALNLDLAKLTAPKKKSSKGESEEEKRLKRLISALRKLQDQYEKLKDVGASDKSIKKIFEGMYPDLVAENGKEFVTDLNYLERAIGLAKQLEKLDSNAGKKLLAELGGDEFSILLKNLKEQNKAYKKAAEAAEDYFKTLREWKAGDFNIDGSGIVFDINKIASDLTTAINKIELKATKLKESFRKIVPAEFKDNLKEAISQQIETEVIVDLSSKFGVEDKFLQSIKDDLKEIDNYDISSVFDVLTKNVGANMAEDIIVSAIPAMDTIKSNFINEFGEDAWSAFWKDFLREGDKAIDNLAAKETEYERKKAQEKLNDLAQKHVNENTSNLDMSNWGDKTLNQITEIQDALKKLYDGEFVLGEDTLKSLNEAGLTIDDLAKKVKELLAGKYNNTITEKIKAIQGVTKKALSIFGTLGSSFKEISEGFSNEDLATAGEYLSVVGEITDAIADCDALWDTIGESAKIAADAASEVGKAAGSLAASLSWITMVIKVVLIIVEQIANAFGRASQKQRELNTAALEYNKIIDERRLDAADSMFGENFRKKVDANIKAVNDAKNAFLDYGNKLLNFDMKDVAWMLNPDEIKKMTNAYQFASKLGYDIYDNATSSIDFAELEKFAKDYEANKTFYENARKNQEGYKLSGELKKELEDLAEFYKAYEEALAKLKEATKEIFGDLADTIASNMIDAFKATGDAAADLGKVFEGLGETLLQSLLSTWVLDNILTKYEDQATKILESMAKGEDEFTIGNMLGDLVDGIKEDVEYGSSFAQQLMELFQERGLLGMEDGGAETLADGIKGITEDTANLLASYLNAIRADVAYSKTLWERMDKSTQAIAAALAGFSAPSLMEYQAQIAANTYNTAMHTQEIMLGLRSVITAEGGLSAIRILQY